MSTQFVFRPLTVTQIMTDSIKQFFGNPSDCEQQELAMEDAMRDYFNAVLNGNADNEYSVIAAAQALGKATKAFMEALASLDGN